MGGVVVVVVVFRRILSAELSIEYRLLGLISSVGEGGGAG